MNKWIISLFAITFISGCLATPSLPKPHPEKYTFQIITVMVQEGMIQGSEMDVEEIINHPDVEICEYPVVLAARGESVTNDQTKVVSLAIDDEVDDKTIGNEKTHKIGTSVAIAFYGIRDNKISYNLNIYHKEQAGFAEYKDENGDIKKKPFLVGIEDDVGVSQEPDSWAMVGGFPGQKVDGKKTFYMICTRAIPPSNK